MFISVTRRVKDQIGSEKYSISILNQNWKTFFSERYFAEEQEPKGAILGPAS